MFTLSPALTESRDITEHLTPLKQRFDEIDTETDFAETEKHLVPLMDDICKVSIQHGFDFSQMAFEMAIRVWTIAERTNYHKL